MTAATLTLTDFLLARIAEDEAVATLGGGESHRASCVYVDLDWRCTCDLATRVLAECEAKRRIVEFHKPMQPRGQRYLPNCEGCWEEGGMDGAPLYPCRTVRWIAAVYADHPDYRDEWRP